MPNLVTLALTIAEICVFTQTEAVLDKLYLNYKDKLSVGIPTCKVKNNSTAILSSLVLRIIYDQVEALIRD